MTWSVVTPDGAGGTDAATVDRPCIVEFGRIIGSFDTLADALKAAEMVNFFFEYGASVPLPSGVRRAFLPDVDDGA